MSTIATLICGFLLWPFLSMWRAYCILILWGWFVLPATGVKPPTMYLLVGVIMTVHLMLPLTKSKPEDGDPFAKLHRKCFRLRTAVARACAAVRLDLALAAMGTGMSIVTPGLYQFIRESNYIEGIDRDPTAVEFGAHEGEWV